MRCVQCGHCMEKLYIQYSPGNIRLVRCPSCNAVADEYIECELMIIVIDLILHKPKAYRHLLFNSEGGFGFLLKSSLLFLLLDAYRTLMINNRTSSSSSPARGGVGLGISSSKVIEAFLCATIGNFMFMCQLIVLSRMLLRFVDGFSGSKQVLLAFLVSSYLKLFMVATMVWEFPATVYYILDLVVMSSNLVALKVITQDSSSTGRCFAVCFTAHASKFALLPLFYSLQPFIHSLL